MYPELGLFSLIIALSMAVIMAVVPLVGAARGDEAAMRMALPAARGHFLFVLISFLLLVSCFLRDDFSTLYVASNSNSALPTIYKISAVWGAHEGSLLLWCLVLAGWSYAVARSVQQFSSDFSARVVGVLGVVAVSVLLFTLFTSNPFTRLAEAPLDGRDLNPLLQDPGLAIHPPLLYMGYVGTAVAFAFSVAVLLCGRLEREWARWVRPWTVWPGCS